VEELYGEAIDSHLQELEEKVQVNSFLDENAITPAHRAVMVEWMVEVLSTFKCSDNTLFIATSLMDSYFNAEKGFKLQDLHIIGVASMFIASKYNDINYLLMKTVFNKIGHKLIPEVSIRKQERDIVKKLNFLIGVPTVLELA
jgi:hypothetical protein